MMILESQTVVMEDQGEDEVRAWFPCPFCYVEIELLVLCVHLQEEHCFDLKNAVYEFALLISSHTSYR